VNKSDLRSIYLAKRAALSSIEKAEIDAALLNWVKQLPLQKVKVVHLFLPILVKNEIDTWPIIRHFWNNYPEIRVVVPVANFKLREMTSVVLTPTTEIAVNKWGIPEPVKDQPHYQEIPPQEIDLVLVPLLAVDKTGQRVGYGAGFYDRFLETAKPTVVTVGLSQFSILDEPISDVLPTDIAIQQVITPQGIIQLPQL
jgi:5-formyltetrahydrofolate cyclo-ligase